MTEKPDINVCYMGTTRFFYNHMTQLMLRLSKWLKSHQHIELTDIHRADMIWVATNEFSPKMLDIGLPIILEDKHQSPEILQEVREVLPHPNIFCLLKQAVPLDRAVYNRRLTSSIIHMDIIARAMDLKDEKYQQYPEMTPKMFDKIRVGWNYIGWGDFVPQTRYEAHNHPEVSQVYAHKINNQRKIDVNFVCNVDCFDPPAPILQAHRMAALEALQGLEGVNAKIIRAKHHSEEYTRIDWTEYYDILFNSKITISPWGWEPVTVRDIEAALAGSLIIKPDTSFLKTWPEFPYVSCKPDFSDLVPTIHNILKKWKEYTETRRKAKYDTVAAIDNIGYRIAELVRECYYQANQVSPLP